jgi:tRNA A-37 threonylcarbamoyl transferase component Bud32
VAAKWGPAAGPTYTRSVAGQSEISSGTMLDDRYRIDELLSVGGMGAVYSATHVLLQKRVAVKVLRSELPHAHLMVDRFHREAIAASAIGHDNIVEVTDMGLLPSGTAYLVMELLEGQSLREVMRAEVPMAVDRACRICCEILRGLGAAHQAGIVHRDLKPDNVFVARKGKREVIKILDFGVSLLKRPNVPDTRLTSTGVIVGTPRYMSPEQAKGEQDLSGAVDIYAAGVVLYEMLTGQLPYFGENYNVIVHEIMAGKWMPLETRRPDVPREICQVVRRALALAPGDRFASAEDMVAELEPFAGAPPAGSHTASRSIPAAPAAAGKMAVALAATEMATVPGRLKKSPGLNDPTPDPAWADQSRPGGRGDTADPFVRPPRGMAGPLFIAVLVLAGAAAAFFLWRRGQDEEPGAPAAGRIDQAAGAQAARAQPADAAPLAAGPADAGAAQADEVTFEFVIVPSTATVYVDDQPVADKQRTPIPRGDTPVKIRIEAPDYAPRTLEQIPDKDRTVSVELVPRANRPEELKGRPKTRPKRSDEEDDPNAPSPEPGADAGASGGEN